MKLQQLHNQVISEQQFQPSTPNSTERDAPLNSAVQNSASPYMFARPQQHLSSQDPVNVYPVPTANTASPIRPWTVVSQNTASTYPEVTTPFSSIGQSPFNATDSVLSSPPSTLPIKNQFQPQTVLQSPVSPPRIQNPVAFLSSVLPSLPSTPAATNSMGLPKSTSS